MKGLRNSLRNLRHELSLSLSLSIPYNSFLSVMMSERNRKCIIYFQFANFFPFCHMGLSSTELKKMPLRDYPLTLIYLFAVNR